MFLWCMGVNNRLLVNNFDIIIGRISEPRDPRDTHHTGYLKETLKYDIFFLLFLFSSRLYIYIILRRMGKNKALAHHTSMYFHTRRVSI